MGCAIFHAMRFHDRHEHLDHPPAEIAAQLLEDSPAGQYLRETRPVFSVITFDQAMDLVARRKAQQPSTIYRSDPGQLSQPAC